MHYFKDKQGYLVAIEDQLWKAVLKNEPWLTETDKHGNELNAPLTLKKEIVKEPVKEVIPEPIPLETLKEEKLKPVKNVKTPRVKRKAKTTKAR